MLSTIQKLRQDNERLRREAAALLQEFADQFVVAQADFRRRLEHSELALRRSYEKLAEVERLLGAK